MFIAVSSQQQKKRETISVVPIVNVGEMKVGSVDNVNLIVVGDAKLDQNETSAVVLTGKSKSRESKLSSKSKILKSLGNSVGNGDLKDFKSVEGKVQNKLKTTKLFPNNKLFDDALQQTGSSHKQVTNILCTRFIFNLLCTGNGFKECSCSY